MNADGWILMLVVGLWKPAEFTGSRSFGREQAFSLLRRLPVVRVQVRRFKPGVKPTAGRISTEGAVGPIREANNFGAAKFALAPVANSPKISKRQGLERLLRTRGNCSNWRRNNVTILLDAFPMS